MFIDEVYIRGCSSLSVPQLTWSAKALVQSYKALEFGSEHTVAYLPLSHIAAQVSPCTNTTGDPTVQLFGAQGFFELLTRN